ncbi:uncharacterized protein N7483_005946 [Penicillium malachiteum]|uniref:uncharacterized protein n=1 Tax=Penicillium malachiteum TaxID=1324776 RepID=UPI00254884F1|nr:uncharacterized protein N7483_005946 [Penicillium malachiteum]KAJ5731438.1 hypothetical protein N7483_005946 [Penicillium malachiteum]
MPPQGFLSIFRHPSHKSRAVLSDDDHSYLNNSHIGPLPWIANPVDLTLETGPRLYRRSDAAPIELFFDLFFVANLSTFTATHEINNVTGMFQIDFLANAFHDRILICMASALGAYVGFLGVIWFTWLQVTLFDIRFARDSVMERVFKAFQLGAMIGFASAGTRFTTRVRDDNLWAFQLLSLMLAVSRIQLAIQYTITLGFMHEHMKDDAKGVWYTALVFWTTTILYIALFFVFKRPRGIPSRIWIIWFVLFGFEMWTVMGISCIWTALSFKKTHLNGRMSLLTLIIIGEGVIAVTRIVNKTVRPGGWTPWTFFHILGVTTNVYLLWQVYFDLSPQQLGILAQQIWAQLHFPFHVSLILLLEGSQILALTLDVTLKLKYLAQTFSFVCEENRPSQDRAIALIRSTINDMEIPFSRGATQEWNAISKLLDDLAKQPLCPDMRILLNKATGIRIEVDTMNPGTLVYTEDIFSDLMGNVTAALFSSMDITPPVKVDISLLDSQQLLQMYMKVLAFVYIYFFAVASISMALFAAFNLLSRSHERRMYLALSTAVRLILAIFLAGLVSFVANFALAYSFMTSPIILYALSLTLLTGQLFCGVFVPSPLVQNSNWLQFCCLTDFLTV